MKYMDCRDFILKSSFNTLVIFVEHEMDSVKWSSKDRKEIMFLYRWWLKYGAKENLEKEQEMLGRLIKIRPRLWT